MKQLFLFILLFGCISHALPGQDDLKSLGENISYYSDVTVNTALPSTRIKGNAALLSNIKLFLQTPESFNYTFPEDVWISIKSPENGSFKIYTWELKKEVDDFDYFGFIQYKDGSFQELNNQSHEIEDAEFSDLDADFWLGALYYNLIESIDAKGDSYYVLFGINRKSKFETNKIAEVIQIKNNKAIFGKEVFNDKANSEIKQRVLLSFSSDANVTLNYNPGLNMIIFDNLIARMGRLPGQGPTSLPDGSYKGYSFEEGQWVFIDKIFNEISETVPGAKPSTKDKKKGLFGN